MSSNGVAGGTGPALLQAQNISKRYGANRALDGVSFELRAGRVYGLIGVNGSGKSTLMKILAGAERATSGQLLLDGDARVLRSVGHAGRLGVGLVPQELPLVPTVSVAENIFLGRLHTTLGVLRPAALRRAARQALAELGLSVDPSLPAGELTLGEQQMVVIARTLVQRARLVLLDEPTSALSGADAARLHRIIRKIAHEGRTVVIVSQRLDDIFAVSDHLLVLRNGRLIGSAATADFTPERAIDLMLHGRGADPTGAGERAGGRVQATPGRPSGLHVAGFRGPGIAVPLTLDVGRSEIVGLAGLPGSGPSEFLRGLFGLTPGAAQEVRILGEPHRLGTPSQNIRDGLAYVTGDRQAEGLVPAASVAANIAMARNRSVRVGPWALRRNQREAIEQIAALRIRPGDPDAPVRSLSGGNQQKVVFARWLLTDPRVWLLDDATRGVDVGARREIHAAIRRCAERYGAAALMVSSDLLELFDVCDRIVVFRRGAVVADRPTGATSPGEIEAFATGTEVISA